MRKFFISVLAILLVFGFTFTEVQASVVSYSLDGVFNGDTPTSTPPWLTVAFEDVSGGVQVTITSRLNVASEFFGQVGFNVLNSGTASLSGGFTPVSGAFTPPTLSTDAKMPGTGNQSYSILLSFATANPGGGTPSATRFDATDEVRFLLTGVNVTNNFSGIPHMGIAAHVQGIPGDKSGAITTPIPAAFWLLGSGLVGLAALRRRMKK